MEPGDNTLRFPGVGTSTYPTGGQLFKRARLALTDPETMRTVSLRVAAKECGVSGAMIYLIESGKSPPSEDLLKKMIEVYQVNETHVRLIYRQPSQEDQRWLYSTWANSLKDLPEGP